MTKNELRAVLTESGIAWEDRDNRKALQAKYDEALAAGKIAAEGEPATTESVEVTTSDVGQVPEPATDGGEKAPETPSEQPTGEDGGEQPTATEGQEEAGEKPVRVRKSIVPEKYKAKYGKMGNCGDELSQVLTDATSTKDGTNLELLVAVGRENHIEVESRWGGLNLGQIRMNLGNVLRNRLKRGEYVVVAGQEFNETGEKAWEQEEKARAAKEAKKNAA